MFGRSKPASWREPAELLLFIKDLLLIVIITIISIIVIIIINSTLPNRLQCNYVENKIYNLMLFINKSYLYIYVYLLSHLSLNLGVCGPTKATRQCTTCILCFFVSDVNFCIYSNEALGADSTKVHTDFHKETWPVPIPMRLVESSPPWSLYIIVTLFAKIKNKIHRTWYHLDINT